MTCLRRDGAGEILAAIISLNLPEIHDNEGIYLQWNGTFSPGIGGMGRTDRHGMF